MITLCPHATLHAFALPVLVVIAHVRVNRMLAFLTTIRKMTCCCLNPLLVVAAGYNQINYQINMFAFKGNENREWRGPLQSRHCREVYIVPSARIR
jgi:hypothetical protein